MLWYTAFVYIYILTENDGNGKDRDYTCKDQPSSSYQSIISEGKKQIRSSICAHTHTHTHTQNQINKHSQQYHHAVFTWSKIILNLHNLKGALCQTLRWQSSAIENVKGPLKSQCFGLVPYGLLPNMEAQHSGLPGLGHAPYVDMKGSF